ncbi:MAG TPA: GrpB family protein [Candidatus Sulfotelmatobacter sp.]|nr:GrpB family protein [Candidatus Sulfotelmatobacter sp.]
MSAPIIIEDYDPQWPEHFERLRSGIAAVLGPLAGAIAHVGSTAIPGLAAKPIIDMDVLLYATADLPEAISRLATQGYQHRGDLGVPGREAFRPPPNDVPHHLYVCVPECLEYARHITFRNHLRTHPEDARAYERLKRALAMEFRNDREEYNQAKTEFVEAVLRRAAMREHSAPAGRIIP